MTEDVRLHALSRASAKFATFTVRASGGRLISYTYPSKTNGKDMTAYKFEVCLVGRNPQEYCLGYVKGKEGEWYFTMLS